MTKPEANKPEEKVFYSILYWETKRCVQRIYGCADREGKYVTPRQRPGYIYSCQRLGRDVFEREEDAQKALQVRIQRRLCAVNKKLATIKALEGKKLPVRDAYRND